MESISHIQPNVEEDLNLHELARVAFSHRKMIAWVTGIFAVLALLYAFLWPKTYEAETTVKVPDSSQTAQGMLRQLVPMSGSGDPIETYVEICSSATVADEVSQHLGLAAKPGFANMTEQQIIGALLKGTVKIANVKTSNIISITAQSHDPKLASDLANAWAQAFIDVNLNLSHESAQSKREFLEQQAKEMKARLNNPDLQLNDESKADEVLYAQLLQDLQQAQIEEKVNDAGIVVVDPAVVPERAVSPKKSRSLLLALILGLLAGLQAAFLLEKLRDRIMSEEQLKRVTRLPNYGLIPDYREDYPESMEPPAEGERFSPKVLIQNPVFQHAYYRESFKILRTNLILSQADKPLKVLAVLSPGAEEGKTLVNANLAISLAQNGKKVLLVDADFRKSSVRKMFGTPNGKESGLPLALAGQQDWRSMIQPSGVEGLELLANMVTPPNPAELLGSEFLKRLIGEFKAAYDYVIFDGAPILPVTDSVVLSTQLDGVVLMARWDKSHSGDVTKSLEHLKAVGTNVVGTLLNCVNTKAAYYGLRYGYNGYAYGNYRYAEKEEGSKAVKK